MDAQRGIARRTVIGLPPDGLDPAWERDFSAYPPAGVIVFRRDFRDLEGLRALTSRLRGLARPRRIFVAIDEEGGHVSQLAGHLTEPPNAMLLGRGAAPGEIEYVSRVTGERLRALGIDWVFAPVADITSEPNNPVIGPRAYGTDAPTVTRHVAEALRGFRASGVASCLKHFPGHGDTVLDSHLALPVGAAGREELLRRELAPFRSNREAPAVMSAHVLYPALDPERPATFSRAIVTELLRGEVGFTGPCITDALEMKGASGDRPLRDAARQALEAGCDLLLFAFHDEEVRRARLELARMLVDGTIDRASFDAAPPRLARFDRDHPEPSAAELGRPLEALTPPDWEARLERIAERGLRVESRRSDSWPGSWTLEEPEYAHGRPLGPDLERLGITLSRDPGKARIVVAASRKPLPAEELERLRRLTREGPTIVVGLQNDGFLDELPDALMRVSASDVTPLTRRVVARRLAAELRAAADART